MSNFNSQALKKCHVYTIVGNCTNVVKVLCSCGTSAYDARRTLKPCPRTLSLEQHSLQDSACERLQDLISKLSCLGQLQRRPPLELVEQYRRSRPL